MPKLQRSSPEAIEIACVRRLTEIEEKMVELQQEKLVLQRILYNARKEKITLSEVTRRNSFGRILIENKIMESLGDKGEYWRASELYIRAKSVDNNLKDSTFRSHLRRMSERGLIESSTRRGYWRAAKPKLLSE
jgi:DNA-binding transcriptional ArsR family regulator